MSANKNETDIHHQSMEIIETPRLILRPWQEADAAALYKYASNEKIARDAGWRVHPDADYSRTVIRLMLLRSAAFAVTLKSKETVEKEYRFTESANRIMRIGERGYDFDAVFLSDPIGSISIYTGESISRGRAADEGDLGYWLGEPFHNRGYMTEAVRAVMDYSFDNLSLRGLWCSHYAGNEASKAVILKSGFQFHHILEDSYNPMLEGHFQEYFYRVSKVECQNLHK